MRSVRLLLCGVGGVGRAFLDLVDERREAVGRLGLDVRIAAIATSRGTWIADDAPDVPARVAVHETTPGAAREGPGWRAGVDGRAAIEIVRPDLLIDATPTNLVDGEPGATLLRAALRHGIHVATASKGALVVGFRELREMAAAHDAHLRFGGATAAALPTVDLVEWCLAGTTVERIEGVLNGTSNLILTLMRGGASYDEALRVAQERGIAEADPTHDVEGRDTAAKLVLIANSVWDADLRLGDVAVSGIVGLGRDEVAPAAGRLRLVGTASRVAGRGSPIRATVAPAVLATDHPLAHVDGAEKGITFTTDTMGRVSAIGGASSPVGAAAALLRDVLAIFR